MHGEDAPAWGLVTVIRGPVTTVFNLNMQGQISHHNHSCAVSTHAAGWAPLGTVPATHVAALGGARSVYEWLVASLLLQRLHSQGISRIPENYEGSSSPALSMQALHRPALSLLPAPAHCTVCSSVSQMSGRGCIHSKNAGRTTEQK